MQRIKYKFGIIILLILGCKNADKEQEQAPYIDPYLLILDATQEKNANIHIGKIQSTNHLQVIRAYGKTYFPSENIMTITSPFGGAIRSIHAIQGQYVSKGQLIATIEDARFVDLQQDYLLTKSKLKLTQLDYERQKDLNQEKASSDKVFQIAENEYRTNQILLKSLEEKLKLLGINPNKLSEKNITRTISIRTATSGYISNVYVNKGRYILPSESLVDILDQSRPYLKLKIYDKDLATLHLGMKVNAFSANDTSLKYKCKITNVNPQIQEDGSTEVLCSFLNLNKPLAQNLNLIAEIEVSNNPSIILPESAVVDFEGQSFVFVKLNNQKYRMIPVNLGNKSNQQLEILNHKELEGKNIVMSGAYTLLMTLKNIE